MPLSSPARSDSAVALWSTLAALAGSGGVIARLWTHGSNGRSAGGVLAVTAVAAVLALRATFVDRTARVVAVLTIGVIAELLTYRWVGRAPAVLTTAGVVVADLAARPRWWRDRPSTQPSPSAMLAVVASSVVWFGSGSLRWWAALDLAAVALALTTAKGVRPIVAVDRALTWSRTPGPGSSALTAGARRGRFATVNDRVANARRSASDGLRAGWAAVVDPRHRMVVGLAVLAAVVTAPIFWRVAVDPAVFIRGTNDLNSGRPRIDDISLVPFRLTVAHPIWFVTIALLQPVVGFAVSTTLVAVAAVAAATVIAAVWARSHWDDRPPLPWPGAVAIGASLLLLESPGAIAPRTAGVFGRYPHAGEFARGTGYLPLHQWATPTIVMSLPFVLLMFALVQRVVADAAAPTAAPARARQRRDRRALLVVTIVVSLLQPASTLVLVPAAVVRVVLTRQARPAVLKPLFGWFALPGAIICLGEVVFLSSNVSEYEQARWLFRPFWAWHYFGLDRIAFWAVLAIVPIGLWAGRGRYLRDVSVGLSLLSLLIGLVPFLLLEQTTVASIPDADLGVLVLMSTVLLTLSTVRFLAIEVQALWERRHEPDFGVPRWTAAAAVLVLVMLCAGVVDLLAATGLAQEVGA